MEAVLAAARGGGGGVGGLRWWSRWRPEALAKTTVGGDRESGGGRAVTRGGRGGA